MQKDTKCMKELFEIVVRNLSICNLNYNQVISDDELSAIMSKDECFIIEKFTQLMFMLVDELLGQLEAQKSNTDSVLLQSSDSQVFKNYVNDQIGPKSAAVAKL